MKIILVQEAATDMVWEAAYDSRGFEAAVREERDLGIAPFAGEKGDASAYKIYTGTSRASRETAEALFSSTEEAEQTSLLDDVMLAPFKDTEKAYPLKVWQRRGRRQWASGNGRQAESRKDTLRRVGELADRLEAEGRDCVIITRGLAMEALLTVLYRRNYVLRGGKCKKPLDRVRATKQTLHCGGCIHNCMLSNPGCGIGLTKAKEHGILK